MILFTMATKTPMVPMAISLGFGVLYSSIMTLFLVPVGYLVLEDIAGLRNRILHKGEEDEEESDADRPNPSIA